jgi:hypothetical protein
VFLQRFAGFAVALVHLHHFVVEDHQLANRGVEAHVLDVTRDLDNGLVHHLFDGFRSGFVNVNRSCIVVANNGTPGATEEAVHAFDTLGLPRLHGVQRAHEHFVQAKTVGTVVANNVIGVHDVLEGLTHLSHDLLELDVGPLLEEVAQAPSASARPCRCASTPSRHSPLAAVPFFSSTSSERFAFGRSPHFRAGRAIF